MIAFTSLARAIHLASCMLLLGNLVFRLLMAQPVFTHVKDDPQFAFEPLDRSLRKLTVWAFAFGFISGFFWLWLVAARMSGGSLISALQLEVLGTLLGWTQFGRVWEARLGLAAGFVALLFVRRQRIQFVQLLLAMAILASLSLAGHAGAGIGKAHWIHLINDAFHLAAAGFWPAGLAPFAIFLSETLQAKQPDDIQVAALVTQRFSLVSLVTVGVLAITGGVNGYFLVGTFHGLISTVYGRLLVSKVTVFGMMIMIGALNLLWLKPRIIVAAQSVALEKSLNLLRSLRRNVLAELSLGAILMIVVGLLGVTPPAAHVDMSTDRNIPHHNNGASDARDRSKICRGVQVATTTR